MNFKCGIIGLPNVGKSTLFNLLTNYTVKIANYPFSTIQPNIGNIYFYEKKLIELSNIINHKKIIPSKIELIDIAGLIKGASIGIGLGNKFLKNINKVKVILHVVRCFENSDIIHIENRISPNDDVIIVNNELILFDIYLCEQEINNINKDKILTNLYDKFTINNVLKKCLIHLNNTKMLKSLILNDIEKNIINKFNFLTLKPIIYIANGNKNKNKEKLYLKIVNNISKQENAISINIDIKNKLNKSLISKNKFINNIAYYINKVLNLITYFTIENKKVKSWKIIRNTTALNAAKKIHNDFFKGFIKVKVISFNNFIKFKDENKIKKLGKIYYEGKNYIIKDNDILKFLFNI